MGITRVAIAGSTGSIGKQTLEFLEQSQGQFQVVGLGIGSSVEAVIAQAKQWKPSVIAVADESARQEVAKALPGVEVIGDQAELAESADVVVNGVVGFAGLPVTMSTLKLGKRLALANKESLIAAGPVVQPLRKIKGAVIIPVDSEHCAIHQCLRSSDRADSEVNKLLLTASGGPFRGRTQESLQQVAVEEALKHPTWSMGPKITVDSSTLMNKGLEVIEAHELFGTSFDRIEVVVHPQSVVHSMVEFADGAVIAQLSMPDMRLPIAYALSFPERATVPFGTIDWKTLARLDFEAPDTQTFPCLNLAFAAGRIGGTAPAWLSAANEVAVEAFLNGNITWSRIAEIIDATMQHHDGLVPSIVEDILHADALARKFAVQELSK
ncbi:MAG: 1-deoxy-D-xylulose-5-phosphate reductoisomerase [Ilumatobacteraceae bacterium]